MSSVIPFRAPEPSKNPLVNGDVECALLGTLLTKPSLLAALPDGFHPDHYAFEGHADIHRVLVEVGRPGVPAAVLVSQALGLNDREQREYIAKLLMAPVGYTRDCVTAYAGVVTDLYRRRRLVEIADEARAGAFANTSNGSADAALAAAMLGLDMLASPHAGRGAHTMLGAAMDQALAKAAAAYENGGPVGLSTGFPSIDRVVGGLENGTMTVLAGRPGSGKSTLGHQWAVNAAQRGIGVLEFSFEMTAAALGRRTLSAYSGVPAAAMREGRHGEFIGRLLSCKKELNDLPLSIEDGGGLTAGMMSVRARAAQRRHGLGLIMVDHLHIMRPDDEDARHGPTHGIGQMSGALKRMAKEFDCPVLVLAQLNRGVEGREDKRPGLSDLRQAGAIEQDADTACFLYRAELYMQNEPEKKGGEALGVFQTRLDDFRDMRHAARGKADLIFGKVREGELCTVPLAFHGETTSFTEVDHVN